MKVTLTLVRVPSDTITIVHWGDSGWPHDVYRGHRYATWADYAYAIGYRKPRYPVPTLIGGAYVVAAAIPDNASKLVIWCGDGQPLVI